MERLALWQRNTPPKLHNPQAMKITPTSSEDKIREVAFRSRNSKFDHSTTLYNSTDVEKIRTGTQGKFSTGQINFKVKGYNIDSRLLRHNEAHFRCNFSDIQGVLIMKRAWDDDNVEALSSFQTLFCSIESKRTNIEDSDIEAVNNNIAFKIVYYRKAVNQLVSKKERYQKDLNELESDVDINNDDLIAAFKRKKLKHPKFDENSKDNKIIWLNKHVAQFDRDIKEMEIAIKHLKNEQQDDKIKNKLARDIKIFTYDAHSGVLMEIDKAELDKKINQNTTNQIDKAELDKKINQNTTNQIDSNFLGINCLSTFTAISNKLKQCFFNSGQVSPQPESVTSIRYPYTQPSASKASSAAVGLQAIPLQAKSCKVAASAQI